MNMENSLAFKYQFEHKSGRKIIAQSDAEFYHMQGHTRDKDIPLYLKTGKKGEFEDNSWRHGSYSNISFKSWAGFANSKQYAAEEKLNKFWNNAIGYEKLFPTDLTSKFKNTKLSIGYFGCPLKRFLAEIKNQANMEGNKELYDRADNCSKLLYSNQYCLPEHIQP